MILFKFVNVDSIKMVLIFELLTTSCTRRVTQCDGQCQVNIVDEVIRTNTDNLYVIGNGNFIDSIQYFTAFTEFFSAVELCPLTIRYSFSPYKLYLLLKFLYASVSELFMV